SHDPVMAAWISQVTLRLRREVTWCWHQRAQCVDPGNGTLPPVADPTAENLNLIRYEHEKQHFFVTDVTARYLTEEIDRLRPTRSRHRGRWGFVVQTLKLDEAAQFILALALASRMDAGLAPVYCTCMNDLSRPYPTLALAQRLWYDPLAIIDCADVGHLLYRYGLLSGPGESQSRINWLDPIEMPTLVSHALLHNNESLPRGLSMLGSEKLRALSREGTALAHGLAAGSLDRSQIVPLVGLKGTEFAAWASTLAQRVGRPVIRVADEYPLNCGSLSALATVCWMRGLDILLPEHWGRRTKREGPHHTAAHLDSAPVRWYVPIYCENQIADLDSCAVTPPLKIAPLSFEERVSAFHRGLPDLTDSLYGAVEECARRFRFQDRTI
ncbi:MAG: hypothetical protein GY809_32370, partial [Planctomycetes bacterium]|nr:hypothetical protein [Planctomycetota bacterium]